MGRRDEGILVILDACIHGVHGLDLRNKQLILVYL
jgi:hypothetical protein